MYVGSDSINMFVTHYNNNGVYVTIFYACCIQYIYLTYVYVYTLLIQARSIRRAQDVRKQLVTIMDRYAAEWVVRIMTYTTNLSLAYMYICTFDLYTLQI